LVAVGDVKFVTVLSTISCWTISIGLGWLLGVILKMGITGFWIAFAADELFRVCGYLLRWRTGNWKSIKI
jgi:Na+-driven multidrug efflux pump